MKTKFMLAVFLFPWLSSLLAQQLEIHQINVGVGAATLILAISPNYADTTAILIDAGQPGAGYDSVRAYLVRLRIRNVRAVYATHYDNDHIGGFAGTGSSARRGLLSDGQTPGQPFTIGRVYDRGTNSTPSTKTYARYNTLANTPLYQRTSLNSNRRDTLFNSPSGEFNSIILTTAAANGVVNDVNLSPNNENERSAVFLLTFRNFRYFIGGDLSGTCDFVNAADPTQPPSKTPRCGYDARYSNTPIGTAVNYRMNSLVGPHMCGALLPHHGADNGFFGFGAPGFSGGIAPGSLTFMVISSGKQDGYKHPRPGPLQLLERANVTSFVTAPNWYDRPPGRAIFNCNHIIIVVDASGNVTVNGQLRNCNNHPR